MNIFSLPIVEVAISVIISWALFSILCSMIQEALVQIKSERGRFFKKQLLRQFFDTPNQINWASILYTHSSIDLLSRAYNKPASDITPKIFAEALIETVANAHIVQTKKNEVDKDALSLVNKYENKLLNDFSFAVRTLLPSDVVSLLKSSLIKAEIRSSIKGNVSSVNENYKNEDAVYTFLVEEISEWYKQFGERTSVWYKKTTKQRLFFLGLILSVLLNVDSIQLFQYFSTNPEVRTEMIRFYQENEEYLTQIAAKYDSTGNASNAKEVFEEAENFKKKTDSLVMANNIPVGMHFLKVKKDDNFYQNLLLKILGFIISAFAASVGAPYWFDILKKGTPLKK